MLSSYAGGFLFVPVSVPADYFAGNYKPQHSWVHFIYEAIGKQSELCPIDHKRESSSHYEWMFVSLEMLGDGRS